MSQWPDVDKFCKICVLGRANEFVLTLRGPRSYGIIERLWWIGRVSAILPVGVCAAGMACGYLQNWIEKYHSPNASDTVWQTALRKLAGPCKGYIAVTTDCPTGFDRKNWLVVAVSAALLRSRATKKSKRVGWVKWGIVVQKLARTGDWLKVRTGATRPALSTRTWRRFIEIFLP